MKEEPEMTEAPHWALNEAARRAGWDSYGHFLAAHAHPQRTINSIHAHAITIAKYETPPVDPDIEKAWELLADECYSGQHESGLVTRGQAIDAILAAIKYGRDCHDQ